MNHVFQQPVPMVRDEDFLVGVLTRRCFAFLLDFVVISVIRSIGRTTTFEVRQSRFGTSGRVTMSWPT